MRYIIYIIGCCRLCHLCDGVIGCVMRIKLLGVTWVILLDVADRVNQDDIIGCCGLC